MEEEFGKMDKERELYKKALYDKDKECEDLRRELAHMKLKLN